MLRWVRVQAAPGRITPAPQEGSELDGGFTGCYLFGLWLHIARFHLLRILQCEFDAGVASRGAHDLPHQSRRAFLYFREASGSAHSARSVGHRIHSRQIMAAALEQ